MGVDIKTVERMAVLARLGLEAEEKQALAKDLDGMLTWVEQLTKVNVEKVEPMTGVLMTDVSIKGGDHKGKLRDDVTETCPGANVILTNAPARKLDFFTIPKVVE